MLSDTSRGPIDILLVEDSDDDVFLMKEVLKEAKVRNNLHVVEDGTEAISFLRREGKYGTVPRPNLILLDLNLPKKSGHEVLQEIKADKNLRSIPVVVLSTSSNEEDITRSYDLYATSHIVKAVDLDQFIEEVKNIEQYWLVVVQLPPK